MKRFLVAFLSYLILDFFWFQFSLPSYKKVVGDIQGNEIRSKNELNVEIQTRILPFLAYILLPIGLTIFVLNSKNNNVFYGALYGLVVYGIFNLTNRALFKNWSLNILVLDTLWGTIVSALTVFIVNYFL